jgi:hypothetical protein
MLSVLPFFSFRSCHQSVHEIVFPCGARTILPSWTCDAFWRFRLKEGSPIIPSGRNIFSAFHAFPEAFSLLWGFMLE